MDESQEYITIPIREYESVRNSNRLQDPSIMKDLHQLLVNRDEDVKRYKEKYEQCQSVLQRTQKQLDKCMQHEQNILSQTSKPQRSYIPLNRPDNKPTKQSNKPIVVARAVGDKEPVEQDELTSMPDEVLRSTINNSSLRSLPTNVSLGSPGMSTALLKRLIQENLRLKTQLEKQASHKSYKQSEDAESTISELKHKISKQQQIIDSLTIKSGSETDINKLGDEVSLTARIRQMAEEAKTARTLDMNKIVIDSMKQENERLCKEKENLDRLVLKYQQMNTNEVEEKTSELNTRIDQLNDSNKKLTTQLDAARCDLQRVRQELENSESSRELVQQNYNMLCAQMQRRQVPSPSIPQSSMPQSVAMYGSHPYHDMTRSPVQSRQPHRIPQETTIYRTPSTTYMQESSMASSSRPTQSFYPPARPLPQPSERKTFKCPRCDTVFENLPQYREHIKVCLKS